MLPGEASGYTLEQGQDQQGNHIVQITMQNNGQQQGPRPGLHVPHPLRPWGGSRPLAGVGAAVSNGKGFLSGSSDESKILRMGHSGDSFRVAGEQRPLWWSAVACQGSCGVLTPAACFSTRPIPGQYLGPACPL